MPRAWRVGFASALLAWAATTSAQERAAVRLSYEVAPELGCPEEREFRDTVAGRLGYDPFRADAPRLIETRIERRGARLHGTVRVKDANDAAVGSRQLQAGETECAELVSSLAVAVSILLDPLSAAAPPADPPPPQPPPPPPKPPAPVAPPVCPEPSEPTDPARVFLAGHAGASVGVTPGFAIGPSVTAGVTWTRISIGLEGRVDFTPLPAPTDGDHEVRAAVFSAGPRGCFRAGIGIGCVAAQGGVFQAHGVDFTDERTPTGRFVSADVSAGLTLPISDVTRFEVLAELRAPVTRTSLTVGGETVWTAPPLALGLRFGVALALAPSE
jgi:hypothetical protein